MRQDQYEKLQALEEQLLDVFIQEANPEKWPGHGIEPAAMDQQTRGDRYWCKKNPAATLMLATKVQALIHQTQVLGDTPPADGDSSTAADEQMLDGENAKAEREAKRLMAELQKGSAGKAKFDRKVHGRASG